MKIEFIPEFQISLDDQHQISELLKQCFPEEDFKGRTYFRQLPHYRLLLRDKSRIIGQLAVDYRVMVLDQIPIKVIGVVDLAVLTQYQKQGHASSLLQALDELVDQSKVNIDIILLCTRYPKFYEKSGFVAVSKPQTVRWLAMDNHVNHGIKTELITDDLMYKKVGDVEWKDHSVLDMLGYWY
ncbi:GNAT family N-acetyltransferase [Acinetobacter stercoris]|uniref:N-acetyltransferase domain-containing protein n=1 Tax=Acinetobacter stercoris TaxID=2126983 RepID=A0A2U3N010_9GAMM|nr:GNAT family N-acetyltransferase [Acinetobacter stercoris]SPL71011.1 hypothetical protein KPC_2189 [Acinetobacter stercoris]